MRLALAAAALTLALPLAHAGDAARDATPRTDRANLTERTTTLKGAVSAERRFPLTRIGAERNDRDGIVDRRRARPPVIRGPFGAM